MYLDTAIVTKLFFLEAESDQVQEIISEQSELYSSDLLIAEFYSVAARKLRENRIDQKVSDQVLTSFNLLLESGAINLLPVTTEILLKAGKLIHELQASVCLRSLDAIHLATSREYQLFSPFSNDKVMLKAAEILGLPTTSV